MDKAQQLSLIKKFDADFTSANEVYHKGSKKSFYLQTLELTDDYEGSQEECQGYLTEIQDLRKTMESSKVSLASAKSTSDHQLQTIKRLEEELVKVRSHCDSLKADNNEGASLLALKQEEIQGIKEACAEWETLAKSVRQIPFFGKDTLSYQSDMTLRWKEHTQEWNNLISDFQQKYLPALQVWSEALMKAINSLIRRVKSVEIS